MDDLVEFPELMERARQGDVSACKELAHTYYQRNPNSALAYEWYFRAARLDDAEAQYRIGLMYFQGIGKKNRMLKKPANGF